MTAAIMTRTLLSTTRCCWSVTGLTPPRAITGSSRTPGALGGAMTWIGDTSSSGGTLRPSAALTTILWTALAALTEVWRLSMCAAPAPSSVTTPTPWGFTSQNKYGFSSFKKINQKDFSFYPEKDDIFEWCYQPDISSKWLAICMAFGWRVFI